MGRASDDAGSPAVAVLMATFNGRPWIADQVASILGQQGVAVELFVSDDGSTDGTWEWLEDLAARDPRVHLLERRQPARGGPSVAKGAAANFYRVLLEARADDGAPVAFADQDDVWLPGKLAAAVSLLSAGFDGVSSDVMAVGTDGARRLVRKSRPQRRFDYLFESPGPGSTIMVSPRLAGVVRGLLAADNSDAVAVDFHDWLVYAVCRARGWRWQIRPEVTVEYRQHGANAFGANVGIRPAQERLRLIRSGWHRDQSVRLARIAAEVAPPERRSELEEVLALLLDRRWRARLRLGMLTGQMRRRARDRWIMAALVTSGCW